MWSGQVSLWEAMMYNEEQRSLRAQEAFRQQKYRTEGLKAKANAEGIFYEKDEDEFDDANLLDVITPVKGGGGTTGAGLSTFSANSMDEYNFLRDKHTADRDLAMKSLDTLKIIASNTSDEAGTEGRKGWRRRAQEGLDLKSANAKELGTWAFSAGNWLGNGGRTDSQVRADQSFDMFGDPTGGTYENDRYRNMKAIRNKYAVNGLLDPMRSPSGEFLGDSVGYSKFGSTIKSGSQEDLFREEYEQMKVQLKAEYKHRARQDERREELAEIKKGVDKQESIKGILGNMLAHMQNEAKTLNQEAL